MSKKLLLSSYDEELAFMCIAGGVQSKPRYLENIFPLKVTSLTVSAPKLLSSTFSAS